MNVINCLDQIGNWYKKQLLKLAAIYSRPMPFLKKYMGTMGWNDPNWLEDVHLGYQENRSGLLDRNTNGWVSLPEGLELPDNQQERDMIARELLIKLLMLPRHPMIDLNKAYRKF